MRYSREAYYEIAEQALREVLDCYCAMQEKQESIWRTRIAMLKNVNNPMYLIVDHNGQWL